MKLAKYHKLRLKFEVHRLEQNYFTLDKILYYFSFLGNIFLIYFGYFFVKSITNSIPPLFPFQNAFFTVFIALFLTGYELTKRFALEQLAISLFQIKRLTPYVVAGVLICLGIIAGSFYLSVKGAHRLVDTTETVQTSIELTLSTERDSIAQYYNQEITFYRSQPGRTKQDRQYRDSIVATLQEAKESKIKQVESRFREKANTKLNTSTENTTAFFYITVFLELLILIGVGFNAFYTVGSYDETKKLLQTPRYRQLELNLKLLKLYYQNGKKTTGDPTLSYNKFQSLVQTQGVSCSQRDLKAFVTLCQELDIIRDYKARRKEFTMSYEQARSLVENQESL